MSEINKSPWPGPKGLIPVTSGRAEDANVYNRNFLDSIHMEMRVIDSVEPDLTIEIFGEKYASPIMMLSISHLNKVGKNGKNPMIEYAKDAKELNVLNWVGMEPNEEYAEISDAYAKTVRIIKPFTDHSIIIDQIEFAKAHGAVAVSVGRGILAPLLKTGKDGVVDKVKKMNEELSELMMYTGIKDTKSFDPSVLHIG